MKKRLVTLLKLGISVALISYLVWQAQQDKSFAALRDQPKDWRLLAAAWACMLMVVVICIFRWLLLVRALGLPFPVRDAFRLGFLGFLFNFVSLGSVGGDLFKAVLIARQQEGRRLEAVATVVIDRVVGLYALLLVATTAILLVELPSTTETREVRIITDATVVCTLLGAVAIAILLIPGITGPGMSQRVAGLPLVETTVARLIATLRIYRSRYPVILVALVMSIVVHGLVALTIWLIARGLPGDEPTLWEHYVIVPLSMVAGALPLPLAGLGALELALDFLYRHVPAGVEVPRGQGLIVALSFRVIMMGVAVVGLGYYLASRREVDEARQEAEEGV